MGRCSGGQFFSSARYRNDMKLTCDEAVPDHTSRCYQCASGIVLVFRNAKNCRLCVFRTSANGSNH